jgi:outer membrane protein assembly factor BamB
MAMRNNKWLLFTLIVLIIIPSYLISVASTSSATALSNATDWTTFRHDPEHSGYTSSENPTDSVRLLWSYKTGRMVQSSPAVADGYVFVGSRDSQLFCLNASNGEAIWKISFRFEVWSSPTVHNGAVYVGADDGWLYSLNVTNGIPIWRSKVGGPVRSSPAIVDDRVYIGAWDGAIFCFNATNGSQIWSHPTTSRVESSPAVSNGIVYFATNDYYIYALNATTGDGIWSRHTGSTVSSPTVFNGYVYVGSYDGYIFGLNASTGSQIWRYQTEDCVESSPAVAYGYVYIGSDDNNLYCLNASTGEKIWRSPTGYWVISSPAVADGNVYIGSEDSNIYCFNALTGEEKWSYPTGNYIESSPSIVNNTLYVGSDDKCVYALTLYISTTKPSPSQAPTSIPWSTLLVDGIVCATTAVSIFVIIQFIRSTRRTKLNMENGKIPEKHTSWYSTHSDALFVLVILAFSIIFYINLSSGHLWHSDEQTYSQWAYHMVKTGDYLNPWAFGELSFWIVKPPLYMWLMSLSYQAFGVSNITSRLPSAIFGSLSLVLVFFLGKKLYNSSVGFLSAIVLGTFATFYSFSRHAMTDVTLTFFIIASVYFFVVSEKTEKTSRYAVLSGVFFGLALMTKQLQALLIPLIIFIYLLFSKRSARFFFKKQFTVFWATGLLLFSPWLIYMAISYGPLFWQNYFVFGTLTRSMSPIEGHTGSYLYYFSYLLYNEYLWAILLPFAAGFCTFRAIFKSSKSDILIVSWMALVLLVFSFAQTKLYWYILPAYPAFALAIGNLMWQLSKKISSRHPRLDFEKRLKG